MRHSVIVITGRRGKSIFWSLLFIARGGHRHFEAVTKLVSLSASALIPPGTADGPVSIEAILFK